MQVRAIFAGALTGMRSARGTLAFAFAMLAVTFAAGTITFSIVDGVALRPLPYRSPGELVGIAQPGPKLNTIAPLTPRDFMLLRERAQAFVSIAASRPATPLQLADSNGSETLATRAVTTNLFDVLGVTPAAGRLFADGDSRPAGPRAAVLSHELWTRAFGARRDVVGTMVAFGAESLQIVGVLPRGVWHPMELNPPAVYVPYVETASDRANGRLRTMSIIGRLQSDVSQEQAHADVARVLDGPAVVQALHDQVVGSTRQWLLLLLAAVALVLLIACANVTTLLLARATVRAREFAIRASLGEPRHVLFGGLLVEGLLLALAAGGAAAAVSVWGVDAAKAALPSGLLTRVSAIAVDGRVLSVLVGIAAVSALGFSTAPAWLATRSNLQAAMNASGGPVIGGRSVERSLATFLITEVAVVCVLLVAATLVVRSFIEIVTTDLGFDRQNIAAVQFMRDATAATETARRIEGAMLRNELLAAARSVPGVIDAAIAVNASVPLSGMSARYSLGIPDFGEALGDNMLETRIVTPEYFTVMGMQLVGGRLFDAGDREGAPRVILINEAAAARFFPGRTAVGQVVTFRGPTTIVGVLRSVRFEGPEGEVRPEMYIPADQEHMPLPRDFGNLVFRTAREPQQIGVAVRDAMRPLLGAEPGQTQIVNEFFRSITAGRRLNALVMGALGLVGVAIGIAGVYGTMQFLVIRQFRDIGLRLALGATRARIVRTVLIAAWRRVALGVAGGLALSWAISSTFRSLLFGITPTEPSVYLQVAAALALVGVLAALLPAMRAANLDPADTLRRE